MRTLTQQFGAEKAKEILLLAGRVRSLRVLRGPTRYYAVELANCLGAGFLLAAAHIAASLLELTVRRMLIAHISSSLLPTEAGGRRPVSPELELERMKNLGFKQQVETLQKAGLFGREDAEIAKRFYQDVRVPLHHGLVGRFVDTHDPFHRFLREMLPLTSETSLDAFEEVVESSAFRFIETVVGILERNAQ